MRTGKIHTGSMIPDITYSIDARHDHVTIHVKFPDDRREFGDMPPEKLEPLKQKYAGEAQDYRRTILLDMALRVNNAGFPASKEIAGIPASDPLPDYLTFTLPPGKGADAAEAEIESRIREVDVSRAAFNDGNNLTSGFNTLLKRMVGRLQLETERRAAKAAKPPGGMAKT